MGFISDNDKIYNNIDNNDKDNNINDIDNDNPLTMTTY